MKKMRLSQKQKNILALSVLLSMLLLGIGIMVYPLISSAYMEKVQSQIQTQYQEQIKKSNTDQLDELRKAAEQYNQRLASGELSLLEPEENGYFEQLMIPDVTSVMAYIHIPKIYVNLPVYHGVGTDSLSSGCGHMPQSSLPIGGESTHAVLSAHTGMASSAMFSDLPLLEPGDTFQVEVLGDVLTYEIQSAEDIQTVLPVEVQSVQIQNGEDLCTLVTCVPFGVNTHRLLVTGHRIPTPASPEPEAETENGSEEQRNSVWLDEYIRSVKIGLIVVHVILLGSLLAFIFLRRKGRYEKAKGDRRNA